MKEITKQFLLCFLISQEDKLTLEQVVNMILPNQSSNPKENSKKNIDFTLEKIKRILDAVQILSVASIAKKIEIDNVTYFEWTSEKLEKFQMEEDEPLKKKKKVEEESKPLQSILPDTLKGIFSFKVPIPKTTPKK